ncbi:4-alpha-L-fucosyltransferase [Serratia fonticola AU-P3(3)]|nr:4-alpha-L-fucosyltransferase [Serratia fonticola AU-P3(3)]
MKILHICSKDKFIPSFVNYIDQNFDSEQHFFWVFGHSDIYKLEEKNNVKFIGVNKSEKIKNIFTLIKDIHQSDKVILHGLLSIKIVLILFFIPWVMKKCFWFIWGGDLYSYKAKRNIKWYLKELIRRPVIKRMGHLVTYVKGDYELTQKWYGCSGDFLECLMYTSNVYKYVELPNMESEHITILLGNSADPSNNHLDALIKISKYKNENIKVMVPLSYGEKRYAENVITEGKKLLGDKFIPITEFMSYEKYLSLLANVDIAVFNHNRQQAMGNTISLLGLKKTVYINSYTTQWQLFNDLNIKVLDVDDFSLKCINENEKNTNVEKIKNFFSDNKLAKQLKFIFES